MTISHSLVRADHAPTKEKARTDQGAAHDHPYIERDFAGQDPLTGWFDLAKTSRNRRQKSSRKRNNYRGQVDAYLVALKTLMFVFMRLIVGGVRHG